MTNDEVAARIGCSYRTISYWYNEAKRRGYDPAKSFRLEDRFLTTAPRSGRPIKGTEKAAEPLEDPAAANPQPYPVIVYHTSCGLYTLNRFYTEHTVGSTRTSGSTLEIKFGVGTIVQCIMLGLNTHL